MSGFWVVARAGEHRYARTEGQARRVVLDGESRKAQRLPPSHLWTATIRNQLQACPQELVQKRLPQWPHHIPSETSESKLLLQSWQEKFQDLHCLVVGYMEVQVEGAAHYTKLLDATARICADFWAMTTFCQNPLLFCNVTKAVLFHEGVSVHALGATLTWQARNWSFLLTPSSARTLQRHWASTVRPADAHTGPPQSALAVFLPVPHALLLLAGRWERYGFPLLPAPTGPRKTRSWFHLSQHLQRTQHVLPALTFQAVRAEAQGRQAEAFLKHTLQSSCCAWLTHSEQCCLHAHLQHACVVRAQLLNLRPSEKTCSCEFLKWTGTHTAWTSSLIQCSCPACCGQPQISLMSSRVQCALQCLSRQRLLAISTCCSASIRSQPPQPCADIASHC